MIFLTGTPDRSLFGGPPPTEGAVVLPSAEELKIRKWRLEVLERAGYDHDAASRLALSKIDLHDACDLLSAGCPVTTALRILL